jgi:hypothetical protein
MTPESRVYIRSDFRSLRVHTIGLMSQTVSLSTRVTPQVRDRLAAEARARGVPLATYTRELLSAPPRPASGEVADPVQNEVRCIFTHLPPETGLAREICLALARTVEAGGSAGISAGKALLEETERVQRLYAPEYDDDDEDEEDGDDAAAVAGGSGWLDAGPGPGNGQVPGGYGPGDAGDRRW